MAPELRDTVLAVFKSNDLAQKAIEQATASGFDSVRTASSELLAGLGLSDAEIAWYAGEARAGAVVVVVTARGRYNEAFALLRRLGAYDMASGRPAA